MFVAPTVEEVRAYCQERGNSIDPEKFIDYYMANGWMVGRVRMKDWKATVRRWEKNDLAKTTGTKNGHQAEPLPEKVPKQVEIDHADYNPANGQWKYNAKACKEPNCQRAQCRAKQGAATR